mgnify:FL=1
MNDFFQIKFHGTSIFLGDLKGLNNNVILLKYMGSLFYLIAAMENTLNIISNKSVCHSSIKKVVQVCCEL